MEPEQLEPEAFELTRASAQGPSLDQLGPEKGRLALDKAQIVADLGRLPQAQIHDLNLPGGPGGPVSVRILRPLNASLPLPVILYVHGAGWVFGNKHTHDRLIRELAVCAGAAVVFPNYSLSPEARFPTAIEEVYAVARWVSEHGAELGLDSARLAIAGDSVGGNMVAAVTLLAKERGGPSIGQQLLFYPVTDANFDTASYREFAEGYVLRRDAMRWFWDQYAPAATDRQKISASPLRASLSQLSGLPPALVITAEADVLRDEGEAYACKLRQAKVRVTAVRFQGIVHDFMMLNVLSSTAAAQGALALAVLWLRRSWGLGDLAAQNGNISTLDQH
jgi:acetyl esterase